MLSDYKEYLSGLALSEIGDNRTTISVHIAHTLEPIIQTLSKTPQTKLQVYDLIERAILTEDGPSGVITRNPVTRGTQLQALKNIKTAIKSLNTINFMKEMRILGYNDTDMSNHTSHVVAHSEVVDQVKTNNEAANNIITAIKAKLNSKSEDFNSFCELLVGVETVEGLKIFLDTFFPNHGLTTAGNIDIGSS